MQMTVSRTLQVYISLNFNSTSLIPIYLTVDFDPSTLVLDDDVVNLVLPKKCAAGETWKNESSSGKKLYCTIQKGHFSDELSQIVNDAETAGCKVLLSY